VILHLKHVKFKPTRADSGQVEALGSSGRGWACPGHRDCWAQHLKTRGRQDKPGDDGSAWAIGGHDMGAQ
jgi:hypothetical protein